MMMLDEDFKSTSDLQTYVMIVHLDTYICIHIYIYTYLSLSLSLLLESINHIPKLQPKLLSALDNNSSTISHDRPSQTRSATQNLICLLTSPITRCSQPACIPLSPYGTFYSQHIRS